MLGGQRIFLTRQEQSVFLDGATLTFAPGTPSLTFGTPPFRKSGSYTPSVLANGSYTPSIRKTKVGDV